MCVCVAWLSRLAHLRRALGHQTKLAAAGLAIRLAKHYIGPARRDGKVAQLARAA